MVGDTQVGSARKVPRDAPAPSCPVTVGDDGVWHVGGYPTARALLRSTATRQAGFGADDVDKLPRRMRPPVLWRDGAEHRENRRQTARFFTPRRVEEKYRELMHRFADEQCARLRRRGTADLSELSFALAVAVAAEVIGLTPRRPGIARRLNRFFSEQQGPGGWRNPMALFRLVYSRYALAAFYLADVRPAIRARRRQRRDDLISHLLDDGCRNGDVFGECVTFAAAGMVTTREFISLAAWHLFTDDDLRARYVDGDQSTRIRVLHEILRLEPVVGNLARWTTDEVTLDAPQGPVSIPAGARVDISVAAANLDRDAVGEQPLLVCPDRRLADGVADSGLAFGDGPHRCPGAHIAIQESDIFLTKLFALPGLRLARPPRAGIRDQIGSYELVDMVVTVDRAAAVPRGQRG